MRRLILALAILTPLGCADTPTQPAFDPGAPLETRVPGHQKAGYDQDDNGFPDVGAVVNGVYTSVYAWDASGDWYQDLGDGRVLGTVASVDELDAATVTVCDYHNQYRGTFDNDPFMDSGWIKNNIRCSGPEGTDTYHYVIVHESDPRYTGNPDWSIWGSWEYHVLAQSGVGNLTRPRSHVGG